MVHLSISLSSFIPLRASLASTTPGFSGATSQLFLHTPVANLTSPLYSPHTPFANLTSTVFPSHTLCQPYLHRIPLTPPLPTSPPPYSPHPSCQPHLHHIPLTLPLPASSLSPLTPAWLLSWGIKQQFTQLVTLDPSLMKTRRVCGASHPTPQAGWHPTQSVASFSRRPTQPVLRIVTFLSVIPLPPSPSLPASSQAPLTRVTTLSNQSQHESLGVLARPQRRSGRQREGAEVCVRVKPCWKR
ncbi:hypothetical protein Pmani_030970 [Petrolisthes manimaculis]|uniref:Uncharacterized protein n=1 Tax=Petrolisthes manimaculis TaxID=1843537 RepID=A0AAE1NWV8_9EUCA|nr:hypothetical protein Pmani_030970 [Petrolisthes manimaculis]